MPEGHTIRRIAQDHQRWFAGETLEVSSPQGRFREDAAQLDGSRLQSVDAHGKHLCYVCDAGRLHIHLGLYGKFRKLNVPPPEPKGEVRLRVVAARHAFDLNGPSTCELISESGWNALRQRLGPDPLRRDADSLAVWERIHRSRAAIGTLLLDQSVIAGVGNIYRAESLFRERIHPRRLGNALAREEFERLWKTLKDLMRIGVRYNRIITADPVWVGKTRGRMDASERLMIYKKPACPRCHKQIQQFELASRAIYACSGCQA